MIKYKNVQRIYQLMNALPQTIEDVPEILQPIEAELEMLRKKFPTSVDRVITNLLSGLPGVALDIAREDKLYSLELYEYLLKLVYGNESYRGS